MPIRPDVPVSAPSTTRPPSPRRPASRFPPSRMHGGACGSRTGSRTPTATGRDRPRGSTSARSTIPRGSALPGSPPPVMKNPTRSTPPDPVRGEGERRVGVFDLDDYFTDPDLDALFYSGGYTHLNVTIHANHYVDVEAHSNWFGWEQVTFRAEDPTGAIAEDTIIITVLPIDDPPPIRNGPNPPPRFDAP